MPFSGPGTTFQARPASFSKDATLASSILGANICASLPGFPAANAGACKEAKSKTAIAIAVMPRESLVENRASRPPDTFTIAFSCGNLRIGLDSTFVDPVGPSPISPDAPVRLGPADKFPLPSGQLVDRELVADAAQRL